MKKILLLIVTVCLTMSNLFSQALSGVDWVNWTVEPRYDSVTLVKPVATAKFMDNWTYAATQKVFDDTWKVAGDSMLVSNLTSGTTGGPDFFDLATAKNYGACWKAVNDGQKLYVLLKFWDKNKVANVGTSTFEIMTQPTSINRHELSYKAALNDTVTTVYKKKLGYIDMAYARYIQLGGGKALFKDGKVTEFAASDGLKKKLNGGRQLWQGAWAANEKGLEDLALNSHFWAVKSDSTINAIMVMSFDGALSYPKDYKNIAGDRTSLKVGDTISFDVKSNTSTPNAADASKPLKTDYFWSAKANNGYAVNYYSGLLIIKQSTASVSDVAQSAASVYVKDGILNILGVDNADVVVYNTQGSIEKKAVNVSSLDISDLASGVYIVKLNNSVVSYKIVK